MKLLQTFLYSVLAMVLTSSSCGLEDRISDLEKELALQKKELTSQNEELTIYYGQAQLHTDEQVAAFAARYSNVEGTLSLYNGVTTLGDITKIKVNGLLHLSGTQISSLEGMESMYDKHLEILILENTNLANASAYCAIKDLWAGGKLGSVKILQNGFDPINADAITGCN